MTILDKEEYLKMLSLFIDWKYFQITITPRAGQRIFEKLSIVFLYTRGKSYQTSLALDDVRVKPGECRRFPNPPPTTAPPTTTTTLGAKVETTKWSGVPTATPAVDAKAARALAPKPRPSVGSTFFSHQKNMVVEVH